MASFFNRDGHTQIRAFRVEFISLRQYFLSRPRLGHYAENTYG